MPYSRPHYLVTIGGNLAGGEHWQTGARYCSLTTYTTTEIQANLANIGVQDIYDDAAAVISYSGIPFPNTTTLAWAKVAAIGTDGHYLGDPIVYTDPTPTTGYGTTGRMPNQVAITASLWSGQVLGKGNYARMYWPGLMAGVETDGRWSSSVGTGLGANIGAMLTAWAGEISTVSVAAGQCSIMTNATNPTNKSVEWVRIGRVPDTQRRRRRSLVEGYVDTAVA